MSSRLAAFFTRNYLVRTISLLLLTYCYTGNSYGQQQVEAKVKTYLILLGGQSNMVGYGSTGDAQYKEFTENVSYINLGFTKDLLPAENRFGPEVSLGDELSMAFPNNNFIFLKYAIDGSSLLDWAPNYSSKRAEITEHPEFGNIYQRFITKVDGILATQEVEICCMLWMQGERDAKIPVAGEEYEENLISLINALRRDTESENLDFLIAKINPPIEGWTALERVRDAQKSITETVTNTYLIETDDLEKISDSLHYSSKGQIELGKRFANKIINILNKDGE